MIKINVTHADISHAEMVQALAKPGEDILKELTPERVAAVHMIIGISGESGELTDAVKKWIVYEKPIDKENLKEELGDLEFYMEGLRQIFGITREETLVGNMNKLSKRYQNFIYSNQRAQDRADKQ
jgi:NTP pyrophosphatase (non-canonical NTP hydrolase)